jgi:hypothetical protein
MPTPQPGVLPAGSAHAYFLMCTVADDAERTALSQAIRYIHPSARARQHGQRPPGSCARWALGLNSGSGSRRRDALPNSDRSASSRQMGESHRRREEIFFCRLPQAVMT